MISIREKIGQQIIAYRWIAQKSTSIDTLESNSTVKKISTKIYCKICL